MSRKELVFQTCGIPLLPSDRLDDQPPKFVIEAVLKRTALSVEDIGRMHSLGGVQISPDENLSSYLGANSIIVPRTASRDHFSYAARPWISSTRRKARIYCPECSADPAMDFRRIWWRLPLISVCPMHGDFLRKRAPLGCMDDPSDDDQIEREAAPAAVIAMDRKTTEGLADGFVTHAGKKLEIDRWFQLLRLLADELCNSDDCSGWYSRGILDEIWRKAGRRRPCVRHRPALIESLRLHQQQNVMTAVAVAIELFENKGLVGEGDCAGELQPEFDAQEERLQHLYQAAIAKTFHELRHCSDKHSLRNLEALVLRPRAWRFFGKEIGCNDAWISMVLRHFGAASFASARRSLILEMACRRRLAELEDPSSAPNRPTLSDYFVSDGD